MGDEILTKVCKPVKEMNDRTRELVHDMLETMYDADGVGLAAPQVGVLKRIAVIDVTEDRNEPIVLINPKVVYTEGEQRDREGCLSVPDKVGVVIRPDIVHVDAFDIDMKPIHLEGEGLLARAFAHEIDHLDGHLYTEKVEGRLYNVEELQD